MESTLSESFSRMTIGLEQPAWHERSTRHASWLASTWIPAAAASVLFMQVLTVYPADALLTM